MKSIGSGPCLVQQIHLDKSVKNPTNIRDISPHHRRIIRTAWQLGGLVDYAQLNLRQWAHMLGFRGHFLTKSRCYSATFTAIRTERRTYRLAETLTRLGISADSESITVINDWRFETAGYRDDAEIELASAIAERIKTTERLVIARKK